MPFWKLRGDGLEDGESLVKGLGQGLWNNSRLHSGKQPCGISWVSSNCPKNTNLNQWLHLQPERQELTALTPFGPFISKIKRWMDVFSSQSLFREVSYSHTSFLGHCPQFGNTHSWVNCWQISGDLYQSDQTTEKWVCIWALVTHSNKHAIYCEISSCWLWKMKWNQEKVELSWYLLGNNSYSFYKIINKTINGRFNWCVKYYFPCPLYSRFSLQRCNLLKYTSNLSYSLDAKSPNKTPLAAKLLAYK